MLTEGRGVKGVRLREQRKEEGTAKVKWVVAGMRNV